MNKYETALNWLCDQCFHLKIEKGNRCEWVDKCKHYKDLKELVGKATPKKKKNNYVVGLLRCPTCGKDVISEWYKHCPHCGQRIEGEEDDD